MHRINIGNGQWFDRDRAQSWEESTRWDGHNHISRVTGSQWEHERLYRTAGGAWIVYAWSQWQGGHRTYRRMSESDAHAWLIDQGHESAVPAATLAAAEL